MNKIAVIGLNRHETGLEGGSKYQDFEHLNEYKFNNNNKQIRRKT